MQGYDGSYDAVRRYAKSWAKERGAITAQAFVPLSFAAGEAYQFDWSHEIVVIGGATSFGKIAHVQLCHSRMFFVRAYAKAHKQPELTDQTIWQVFEAERSHLMPIAGRFVGFHATTAAVSKNLPGALR